MFARTLLGFSLACLLAASPVLAVEGSEPFISIAPDKLVPEETVATGSESDAPVDADS